MVLYQAIVTAFCLIAAAQSPAQPEDHHYGLRYDLTLKPTEDLAVVTISLDQRAKDNITSIRFHIDPEHHTGFEGDGRIEPKGDYITWTPPTTGGKLSFHALISHSRPNGRYDARMAEDWAIFRGDDIFPPARTDQHDDAEADATLHVHHPQGWTFITAYPGNSGGGYDVEHIHRSFDRPTGWMIAGKLGVRRDKISGVNVIVAGPLNQRIRRLDMMALLNWNIPRIRRLLPDMPERILVVSARDPMFRGGLSGPNSLFIHADRPLLSENGSSTLIHELIHVSNRLEGENGADWIIEGLAEYYSLKILWRSGTISDKRYQGSFETLAKWAQQADRLDVEISRGPTTARAVGIMRKLDHEIHKKTNREKSLDDVVRLLAANRDKVNLYRFRETVVDVMAEPAYALSDHELGFVAIESDNNTNDTPSP